MSNHTVIIVSHLTPKDLGPIKRTIQLLFPATNFIICEPSGLSTLQRSVRRHDVKGRRVVAFLPEQGDQTGQMRAYLTETRFVPSSQVISYTSESELVRELVYSVVCAFPPPFGRSERFTGTYH